MVYKIATVEFHGVEETVHHVRPEIEVHVRTGSNAAIVQVRRYTSPPFTLRAWVHLADSAEADSHLLPTIALIGQRSAITPDLALLTTTNIFAPNQALLVTDVRYRARNRAGRVFIEYELDCVMTEGTAPEPED